MRSNSINQNENQIASTSYVTRNLLYRKVIATAQLVIKSGVLNQRKRRTRKKCEKLYHSMRQFVKVSQYIAREKLFFQTNYLALWEN